MLVNFESDNGLDNGAENVSYLLKHSSGIGIEKGSWLLVLRGGSSSPNLQEEVFIRHHGNSLVMDLNRILVLMCSMAPAVLSNELLIISVQGRLKK